jgi:hypothetical protein
LTKELKLILKTEEIDPLAKLPFEAGVEALIATIEDREELIKAIIASKRKQA